MTGEMHTTTSLEQELVKAKIILSTCQGMYTHLEPGKWAVQGTEFSRNSAQVEQWATHEITQRNETCCDGYIPEIREVLHVIHLAEAFRFNVGGCGGFGYCWQG